MTKLTRTMGLAAGLTLVLVLSGCASTMYELKNFDWAGHRRNLTDTQLKYVHFLRWGEYEAASMLVKRDMRDAFLEEIRPFSQVRLSDYEVLETIFDELETEATVTVTFSAYHMNRLIEHTWMEEQVWKRDMQTSKWLVKPDLEKIRVALAEMEPNQP